MFNYFFFIPIKINTRFLKPILFTSKFKNKNIKKTYHNGDIQIKQHFEVNCLGCSMDETIFGETMALNFIQKINNKLEFFYRKKDFLTLAMKRLFCNALIQSHLDYACSSWYSNQVKKLKQ